jgi:hypothetical protein
MALYGFFDEIDAFFPHQRELSPNVGDGRDQAAAV